jgi:hypothetical protein
MSLDKAIEHGKEHRKPYYKSKRFDRTCRHGGTCDCCKGNRMHSTKRRELSAREQIHEAVSRVVTEAGWIGNTPADQGIMAARDDDRRRTEQIKQDFKVLRGLVREIQDWAGASEYLTDTEATYIIKAGNELTRHAQDAQKRLKVW